MKQIIINEFKSYIRNPFIIITLLCFPLTMIFILGNLVESVQTADPAIGAVTIGYTSDTVDLSNAVSNDMLRFEKVTKEEGIKSVNDETINGYIDLSGSDFIVYEGSNIIANNVLKSITNGMLLKKDIAISMIQCTGSFTDRSSTSSTYTTKRDLKVNMSMFDYYVIAMTIMACVFSSLAASMAFTEERKNRTMNRLITSPMNKSKIFLGKCLGQIPFAAVQVAIILIFSAVAYGTRYASNAAGNILLFLLLVMSAIVSDIIGVIISLIFKRSMAVGIFITAWVLLLFSGIFAKAIAIEPLCNYLAPYRIRCAATDLTLFGNYGPALRIVVNEVIVSIVLIIAGGFIFSKKQEERV